MKRSVVLMIGIALVAAACAATEEVAAPTTTVASTTTATEAPTTTAPTTTTTVAPTTTTTVAPTTTTTVASDGIETSSVVPGEDPDVDAIVETYLVVFDSTTSFEEKAPFITDPTGLEETVEKYASAGDDVGGIALQADEVGINGTDARVIYSFLFAGNPAYSDLEGEAVLTDAGWQVSREFFCGIMDSARVGCP